RRAPRAPPPDRRAPAPPRPSCGCPRRPARTPRTPRGRGTRPPASSPEDLRFLARDEPVRHRLERAEVVGEDELRRVRADDGRVVGNPRGLRDELVPLGDVAALAEPRLGG